MNKPLPVPSADRVDDDDCHRILDAVGIIGVRWNGAILLAAARGARRFSEYRAMVPGISDLLLTQRLKQLQAEELIERTVIPSTPVQILYTLTPDAQGLISALRPLSQWTACRAAKRDRDTRAGEGRV